MHFNGKVKSIARSNTRTFLVGEFTTFQGQTQNRIACLNDGFEIISNFNIGNGFNNIANVVVYNNSKVLVGGIFSSYKNINSSGIIRLNSDGSIDSSFNIGAGFRDSVSQPGPVNAIAIQNDGKILVGGNFISYNNTPSFRLIRLNLDGSIDSSFNIGNGFDNEVNTITIQNDDKILIGGHFTSFNGTSSPRIIRLNSNGSIDNTFNVGTGFNNHVNKIFIFQDKIFVGGNFTSYKSSNYNRIICLNFDGNINTTFNPGSGFNNQVYDIVDGTFESLFPIITVGGSFSSYKGITSNRIINLTFDGNITDQPSFPILPPIFNSPQECLVELFPELNTEDFNFSQQSIFNGRRVSVCSVTRGDNLNTLEAALEKCSANIAVSKPEENKILIYRVGVNNLISEYLYQQYPLGFPPMPLMGYFLENTAEININNIENLNISQDEYCRFGIDINFSNSYPFNFLSVGSAIFDSLSNKPKRIFVQVFKYDLQTDSWNPFAQKLEFNLPPDLSYAGVSVAYSAGKLLVGLPNLNQTKFYYLDIPTYDINGQLIYNWKFHGNFSAPGIHDKIELQFEGNDGSYKKESAYGWRVAFTDSEKDYFGTDGSSGTLAGLLCIPNYLDFLGESTSNGIVNSPYDNYPLESIENPSARFAERMLGFELNALISDPFYDEKKGLIETISKDFITSEDGSHRAAGDDFGVFYKFHDSRIEKPARRVLTPDNSLGCTDLVSSSNEFIYGAEPGSEIRITISPAQFYKEFSPFFYYRFASSVFTVPEGGTLYLGPDYRAWQSMTLIINGVTVKSDLLIFFNPPGSPYFTSHTNRWLIIQDKFSSFESRRWVENYEILQDMVATANSRLLYKIETNDDFFVKGSYPIKVYTWNGSSLVERYSFINDFVIVFAAEQSLQNTNAQNPSQVVNWQIDPDYFLGIVPNPISDPPPEITLYNETCLLPDPLPPEYNAIFNPEEKRIKILLDHYGDYFLASFYNGSVSHIVRDGGYGSGEILPNIPSFRLGETSVPLWGTVFPLYNILGVTPTIPDHKRITLKDPATEAETTINDIRLWVDLAMTSLGAQAIDNRIAAVACTTDWPSPGNSIKIYLEKNGNIVKYTGLNETIIPIIKPWVDLAISKNGKYITAIATNNSIYVSKDFGVTWNTKGPSLNWKSIDMSLDGQFQTAVAASEKIYISHDYGENWTPRLNVNNWWSVSLNGQGNIQMASINDDNKEILISYDYGITWQTYSAFMPSRYIGTSLSKSEEVLKKYRYFITIVKDFNTILCSDNTGRDFFQIEPQYQSSIFDGLNVKIASSFEAIFQTIVIENGNIYISRNFGATWTKSTDNAVVNPKNWKDIAINQDGSVQAAVESNGSIYVSNNFGKNWNSLTDPGLQLNWRAIEINDSGNTIFAIAQQGLYKITIQSIDDLSYSWIKITHPFLLASLDWKDIAFSKTVSLGIPFKYLTVIANNDKIYVSANSGTSWIAKNIIEQWISVDMSLDGQFQTAVTSNGKIYFSHDYGENWTLSLYTENNFKQISINENGKVQIIQADNQVHISYDFGITWSLINQTGPFKAVCINKKKYEPRREFFDEFDNFFRNLITTGWRINSKYGYNFGVYSDKSLGLIKRAVGAPDLVPTGEENAVGLLRFEQFIDIQKEWVKYLDMFGETINGRFGAVFHIPNFAENVKSFPGSMVYAYNNPTNPRIIFSYGQILNNQGASDIAGNTPSNIVAIIDNNNFKIFGDICKNLDNEITGCCRKPPTDICFQCPGEFVAVYKPDVYDVFASTRAFCLSDPTHIDFWPVTTPCRGCTEFLIPPTNYLCSWVSSTPIGPCPEEGDIINPQNIVLQKNMESISLDENQEIFDQIIDSINNEINQNN